MKTVIAVLILAFAAFAGEVLRIDSPLNKNDEKPKAEAPKPIIISLTPELIRPVSAAQRRTLDAKAALEASAVFKEYQLAFSQEQAAMLLTMAEVGAKPSECTPAFDKEGKLTHLECQPKVKP